MKTKRFFSKSLTMLLVLAMLISLSVSFAFAGDSARADSALTQDSMLQSLDAKQLQQVQDLQKEFQAQDNSQSLFGTWVKIRILGYDDGGGGVILEEQWVRLTDSTGYSVLDALEKACADNNISLTVVDTQYGKYVSAIGGQEQDYFQSEEEEYYSGWAYRVWPAEYRPGQPQEDTLPWDAASDYVLENGDSVTWYYDIPVYTWYTVMDNYDDIDFLTWRGRTIEVNVKGQKYEDAINWELTPFTNLAGATVTLTRASDGAELASAVSDAGGDAVLTVPAVGLPTLCYIGVKGKYFTSGDLRGGIEQTASWTKPVIVIW